MCWDSYGSLLFDSSEISVIERSCLSLVHANIPIPGSVIPSDDAFTDFPPNPGGSFSDNEVKGSDIVGALFGE